MLLVNGISDNACIGPSTQLLQQDHMIGNQIAKEAVHGQVACRVIIFNSFDELADGNIRVELIFFFTAKSPVLFSGHLICNNYTQEGHQHRASA